ncbi:MAG: DUF1573 domain-containing protein [Saprospiraceae bacterium]|nr:DUF1573 domain-containing protein [Candidatus Vicinibacter affinis]MBK8642076.1 DUF1573 domain-containing protein [Candidatus Vicinibacter affinis]MBK9961892.1 DUF1573 domain-containing protein [Candidatus Vicinibacter affinis]
MKNQNFLSLAFFAILLSVVSCKNDSANNQSATADPAAAGTVANPGDVANPAGEATPAAPTGPTTTVEYETMVYDFGEVKEGEHVKYAFKFKNTGSEPLVISDAKGSCGCTVPDWPREPIAPGASAEIKVDFDSKGKGSDDGSKQTKRVTVTGNTNPAQTYLTISGVVKKDPNAKPATPGTTAN